MSKVETGKPLGPPPPPAPEKSKRPANQFVPGQHVRVQQASHESFPGREYQIKPPAHATIVAYTTPSFERVELSIDGVSGKCFAHVDHLVTDGTPVHFVRPDESPVEIVEGVGQVEIRFPVDHRGVPGNSEAVLRYSERDLDHAFNHGMMLARAAYEAMKRQRR
jgi:hypothetical protein